MSLDPKQIVVIADIPPIPQLLHQIMSLADNPNTTIQKLESLVNQEPAMVTKILKWVNSALYSFPTKINSVKHAMIILGFSTVRSIASGLALMNAFDHIPGINKNQVLGIWKMGLEAAQYSKLLTYKEKTETQDIIYLAAMIQNVGQIVLSQYFGDKYSKFLNDQLFPETATEETLFETDHSKVGAALLTEWRFSEEVINLVLNHHDDGSVNPLTKEQIVIRISNRLACCQLSAETFNTFSISESDCQLLNIPNNFLETNREALLNVPKAVKLILE